MEGGGKERDEEIGSRRGGKGLYSGGSRRGAREGRVAPLFLDHTKARRAEKMFWETAPPLSKCLYDRPPYLKVWTSNALPSPLFLSCLSTCPALTSSLQLPLTVFNRHFCKRNISQATPRIDLSFFNHFAMSLYNTDSFIRRMHNC